MVIPPSTLNPLDRAGNTIQVISSNTPSPTQSRQLSGSTSSETWSTSTPKGTISSSGTVSPTYYHQYLVTASYLILNGGFPTAPVLTGTVFGSSLSIVLSTQPSSYWLDAGSSYSVTNPLAGLTSLERWETSQTSGTVSNNMTLSFAYSHQYFLSVEGGSQGTNGQGWYDAGQTADATSQGTYSRELGIGQRVISYSLDGVTFAQIFPTDGVITVPRIMNSPHDVQFNSIPQFQVTLDPATVSALVTITPPTINGDDYWYDSGTQVNVTLSYVWNAATNGPSRQNLLSYTIDGTTTTLPRRDSGTLALPLIKMITNHYITVGSTLQYYISASGGTLSGSQTNDSWFDSGSQFAFHGEYDKTYSANSPYHAYSLHPGFQILANTTLSSIAWANNTLRFTTNNADITIFVPDPLNLVPSAVLDDGTLVTFSYSDVSRLMTFKGSSDFAISFARSGNGSSSQPSTPAWETFLLSPIVLGMVALLVGGTSGLLFVKLRRLRRMKSPITYHIHLSLV